MSISSNTISGTVRPPYRLDLARGFKPAMRALRSILLPASFVIFFLLAWQILVPAFHVAPILLVPPSEIWAQFVVAWPILLPHAWPTFINTLVGFLIAAAVGVTLGMLLVSSRRAEQAFWPHILLFQLVPKAAVAPLFIVWFGMGPGTRIALAVFLAFFPVMVSAVTGFRATDPASVRLCQSLTATAWQTFLAVRVPYALPHIFAGLKVGVTVAVIGVIVGEFITGQEGLGYIVMFASSSGQTGLALIAILMLCVVGIGLYGLVALSEVLVRQWFDAPASTSGF